MKLSSSCRIGGFRIHNIANRGFNIRHYNGLTAQVLRNDGRKISPAPRPGVLNIIPLLHGPAIPSVTPTFLREDCLYPGENRPDLKLEVRPIEFAFNFISALAVINYTPDWLSVIYGRQICVLAPAAYPLSMLPPEQEDNGKVYVVPHWEWQRLLSDRNDLICPCHGTRRVNDERLLVRLAKAA